VILERKGLFLVSILALTIFISNFVSAQSYNNNTNTTSEAKPPIIPKSPLLSDSKKQAIINAALNVPGLKAWSNQWHYLTMDFIGSLSGGWQYATVWLRLPVNATAPLSCTFPFDASIEVDISTNRVVEAHYPTLQNFNCNLGCGGPIGYVCPTNNTIIKNTAAYNAYLANYSTNVTNSSFTPNQKQLLTPSKQVKSFAIAPIIHCDQDFELLIKDGNQRLACVTYQTENKLVEQGWRILNCCIRIPIIQPEAMYIGINPRTDLIYVGSSGNTNLISVIDGKTNSIITTIPVGKIPSGIGVNLKTDKIYIVNTGSGTVSVIDGKTNTVTTTIQVGTNPIGIAVNIETNLIYVANLNSDSVSVIDGRTNNVISTISVDGAPHAVTVNPKTNMIYATNSVAPTVFVIDGKTNSVVKTISTDYQEYYIAINPRTNMIYVPNIGGGITVIDGNANRVITHLETQGTHGIGVDYSSNLIYADNGTKYVAVIDGKTNSVIKTVTLPRVGINDIQVNPITDKIYLTTVDGNMVLVISG
jgi:YVTN family beta-propeller protein